MAGGKRLRERPLFDEVFLGRDGGGKKTEIFCVKFFKGFGEGHNMSNERMGK